MKAELDFRGVSRAQEEETRAAADLLGRVEIKNPRRVADVHAGPWSGGVVLAHRFPAAEIVSLDPSEFAGRASTSANNAFDLVFVNGHRVLLPSLRRLAPSLVARVAPRGRLAVQFPNNLYEPNRELLRMVAADGPWANKLVPVAKTRPFDQTTEGLYALLRPLCASVDIWETTYLLVMNGIAAIVDLMMARSLAPFLAPLDETFQRQFLCRYAAELTRAYPAQPDGRVLFRVPRMFFVAQPG